MSEEESSTIDEWPTFIIILQDIVEEIEISQNTSNYRILRQNEKYASTSYRHNNTNNRPRQCHYHRSNTQGRQLYGTLVRKK